MKINLKSLYAALFLAACFSACKKDEVYLKPELSIQLQNEGIDTLSVGDSLVLHPKIANKENISFEWTINGETKSTDSVFSFKPTVRGDYDVKLRAINRGGELSVAYKIHVFGKYENGFFIVNEGWFGHGSGTVGFYSYGDSTITDSVFIKENPGKNLGSSSSTLQFGTVIKDKLYLLVKAGGPLVMTDAYSLKEINRIEGSRTNDWRALIAISETQGLVSTSNGLYPIDMNTLALGTAISGISGEVKDLFIADNYVYAVSSSSGLVILDAKTLTIKKTIAGIKLGCTATVDGSVWAAGGKQVIRINPASLETTVIASPFTINGFSPWNPASIVAVPGENAIFVQRASWNGSGKQIYKVTADPASLNTPFITLSGNEVLYGALGYDKTTNSLMLTTEAPAYSDTNILKFVDVKTGNVKNSVTYNGYHFTSMLTFHN